MYRLPVRWKGKSLMPMKATRVRKFVESGRARIRYDRKLKLHYLQLLVDPSGEETQEVVLGFDPGSTFDGISLVSKKNHHINIELIQRPKKGKNSIKSFKLRQSQNRRIRRSKLRHRKIRFDNRTSNKLVPTIKSNIDFRKWIVTKLRFYYPISKIVIEDVRFNHYRNSNGASFSLVEQGKTELYEFIRQLNLKLELVDGITTKKLRVKYFGFDPKTQDKGKQSFEAHCVDSFVLAAPKEFEYDRETGELLNPIVDFDNYLNKSVTFIEKYIKQRRCLTKTRALYKKPSNTGPYYYRYKKGGIKKIFTCKSNKRNFCRVKVSGEHSNHPKQWEYIDNGYAVKIKCNTARYGGTVINGRQKWWYNNEWNNRNIKCIKG